MERLGHGTRVRPLDRIVWFDQETVISSRSHNHFFLKVFTLDRLDPTLGCHFKELVLKWGHVDQIGERAHLAHARTVFQDGQNLFQTICMSVHLILLVNHYLFLLVHQLLDALKVGKVDLLVDLLQLSQFFFHLLDFFDHAFLSSHSSFLSNFEF